MKALSLAVVAILLATTSLWAQGQAKGQGGIIVMDSVPVYTESDSSAVQYTLNRGDAVASRPDAGDLLFGLKRYQFEPRNGRIRINFFSREPEQAGKLAVGWIDPSTLSIFTFACCDPHGKNCGPTHISGFGSLFKGRLSWTPCFIEARDLKLQDLEKEWNSRKQGAETKPPKTVEVGNSERQVAEVLGQPEKILKVGPTKTIYIYKDVKVTIVDGRVADLQ